MPTVIKAGETAKLLNRLASVDLSDHLAEARRAIEDARRRAEEILANARAQVTRASQEEKDRGYRDGFEEGRREGGLAGAQQAYTEAARRFETEHAGLVASLQSLLSEIAGIKQDLAIAAERDLLTFAVLLARKLTFAIGDLRREAALENLRRALRLVGAQTDVTVRVHPQDLTAVEAFAAGVLREARAGGVVSVLGDERIAPGGCRVTTARTDVDATLETQVEALVGLLLGPAGGGVAEDSAVDPVAEPEGV
ncbi:MAG: hypothetical protein HY763_05965 [Planctomycetes bacterium]|nr:hypothetical protein [Planctomycetota bacterium]